MFRLLLSYNAVFFIGARIMELHIGLYSWHTIFLILYASVTSCLNLNQQARVVAAGTSEAAAACSKLGYLIRTCWAQIGSTFLQQLPNNAIKQAGPL